MSAEEQIRRLTEFDCPEYAHFADRNTATGLIARLLPFATRQAAILIPLMVKNDTIHVLLTSRSHDVSTHKGEVSFPGGSRDEGDRNPVDTALRESCEEIGLPPDYVRVVSRLVPSFTRHNLLVYPVVGLVRKRFASNFTASPNAEVAHMFTLPLERFLSDRDHSFTTIEDNAFSTQYGMAITDEVTKKLDLKGYQLHFFRDNVNGEQVMTFGFTAGFCVLTAAMVFRRLPPFPMGGFSKLKDIARAKDFQEENLLQSYKWRSVGKSLGRKSNL